MDRKLGINENDAAFMKKTLEKETRTGYLSSPAKSRIFFKNRNMNSEIDKIIAFEIKKTVEFI